MSARARHMPWFRDPFDWDAAHVELLASIPPPAPIVLPVDLISTRDYEALRKLLSEDAS